MNLKEKWFKIHDAIRYLIMGTINAGIAYLIFVIALAILGKSHYQLCVALQWGLSTFTSYINQKFFVFNTRGNYIKEYCKCFTTWAVGYVLNAFIIEIMVKYTTINIYISEAFAMVIVAVFTYLIFKFICFKKEK